MMECGTPGAFRRKHPMSDPPNSERFDPYRGNLDEAEEEAAQKRSRLPGRRKARGKRVSLLGLLSLVGAVGAGVLICRPTVVRGYELDPLLVGAGAAAIGLLALLMALGGRIGAGLPFLGLVAGLGVA